VRKRRAFAAALVLLLALAVVYRKIGTPRFDRSPASSQPTTAAPAGTRMRVEVLNASTVRGLARRATIHLRDEGFDVVQSGTTNERRDSTLILDRTNHPDWAARAARAMGGARIESRPDTLRDVDLTVLIGASWRPPAEPFYP
jgi:hypothetical protein